MIFNAHIARYGIDAAVLSSTAASLFFFFLPFSGQTIQHERKIRAVCPVRWWRWITMAVGNGRSFHSRGIVLFTVYVLLLLFPLIFVIVEFFRSPPPVLYIHNMAARVHVFVSFMIKTFAFIRIQRNLCHFISFLFLCFDSCYCSVAIAMRVAEVISSVLSVFNVRTF